MKLWGVSLPLLFAFCIFNLTACSTLKEAAKGIIGVSTKEVEASRKDALKKQFNWGYEECYDKTLKVLGRIGAYIYAQDKPKNLIAIYLSASDTTAVGIFLTQIDANNTQIEVSSASTLAKEYIAEKLFSGLEKGLDAVDAIMMQQQKLF